MGLIVCPDCEQQIGERAQVCPHCGSTIDDQARKQGAQRRQQILIHGMTAVVVCVLGCLVGVLLDHWLGGDGIAIVIGGVAGFLIGSVLGFSLAQKVTEQGGK